MLQFKEVSAWFDVVNMDTSLYFRGLYINKYAALVAILQIMFQVLAKLQKD